MAEAMAATEDVVWRRLGPPFRVDRFEKGHYPRLTVVFRISTDMHGTYRVQQPQIIPDDRATASGLSH
jgi:hypothetical protein